MFDSQLAIPGNESSWPFAKALLNWYASAEQRNVRDSGGVVPSGNQGVSPPSSQRETSDSQTLGLAPNSTVG